MVIASKPQKLNTTGAAPRVAVVGAGPCGLTAVKNLLQAGLSDIICFEERGVIGGQWAYSDQPGKSGVYDCVHTISSKTLSSFPDFPMPGEYPDFPSHRQIADYFTAYADAFSLHPHIHLRSRVESISPAERGGWKLKVATPKGDREEVFSHLLIATGHHWSANMPAYPGSFDGESLHSHDFKTAEPFRGKSVLVVGGGNSACDIAVDLSNVTRRTALSMRRGYHIVPKLIFGSPADLALQKLRRLPKWCRDRIAGVLVRLIVGRHAKYGMQEPEPGLMKMHPTLNSAVLNNIRHGKIEPRAGIDRLEGHSVRFVDGRLEAFDVIVWATGYKIECPILADVLTGGGARQLPQLYLKMIPEAFDTAFIIGLFQPTGCIWTFADKQAQVAALHIAGRVASHSDLGRRIRRESKLQADFDQSDRHQIEVDAIEFEKALDKEVSRASI